MCEPLSDVKYPWKGPIIVEQEHHRILSVIPVTVSTVRQAGSNREACTVELKMLEETVVIMAMTPQIIAVIIVKMNSPSPIAKMRHQ